MRPVLAIFALLVACTAAPGPPVPDGKNRVVDIVNTGDQPLHFRARPSGGLSLSAPIAGEVAAHYYLTVNFDLGNGTCLFDLTAIWADGATVTSQRFDACTEVSWVVAP